MVESRIKKVCMSAMESRFPELVVKDFEIRKTFKYEKIKEDWVEDSYSVFIQVVVDKNDKDYYTWDVETFLTSLFGFECCVDLVKKK